MGAVAPARFARLRTGPHRPSVSVTDHVSTFVTDHVSTSRVSPHPSLGAAGLTGGLIEAPPDAWKS